MQARDCWERERRGQKPWLHAAQYGNFVEEAFEVNMVQLLAVRTQALAYTFLVSSLGKVGVCRRHKLAV